MIIVQSLQLFVLQSNQRYLQIISFLTPPDHLRSLHFRKMLILAFKANNVVFLNRIFSTDFSPLHFHCMSVKGAGKQPSFWRWEHFFLQWSLSNLSRVAVWKSAHFLTVRVRARAQTFNCVTSQTVKNCSDYRKYNKSTYVFFFFFVNTYQS